MDRAWRQIAIAGVAASFVTLNACVVVKGYPGKALPNEDVAVIETHVGLDYSTAILIIDDYRLQNAFNSGAEVPAGCHRIVASLGRAGFSPAGFFTGSWVGPTYAGCTEFIACLEPGQTYELLSKGNTIRLFGAASGPSIGSGYAHRFGLEGCPYAMNSYDSPLLPKDERQTTAGSLGDEEGAVENLNRNIGGTTALNSTPSGIVNVETGWDGQWLGEGAGWSIKVTIDRGQVSGAARNNTACRPCTVTGKIDQHGLVNAQIPSREHDSSAVLKGKMPTLKLERRWMPTSQEKIAFQRIGG